MTQQKTSSPRSFKAKQRSLSGALAIAWALTANFAWHSTVSAASEGDQAQALAQWWQRFDDPLLNTLVTQALQSNTSLRAAQAALQQARALRDAKRAGLQPSVGASGSARRSQTTGAEAGNSFGANLEAQWSPDVFGGNRSALEAADLDAQALGVALVHLLARELAAFHAQHLDPLDALAGALAARLVVLFDAGLHAAAAAAPPSRLNDSRDLHGTHPWRLTRASCDWSRK